jgi:hypothetical protein
MRRVDAFDRKPRPLDVGEQRFGIGADTVETATSAAKIDDTCTDTDVTRFAKTRIHGRAAPHLL